MFDGGAGSKEVFPNSLNMGEGLEDRRVGNCLSKERSKNTITTG